MAGSLAPELPLMPEIVDDPLSLCCWPLLSEPGIEESQPLGPDRFLPRALEARGRFAKGSWGNPRGRPPGIRNPKRRVPDLFARPLSPQALANLIDRSSERRAGKRSITRRAGHETNGGFRCAPPALRIACNPIVASALGADARRGNVAILVPGSRHMLCARVAKCRQRDEQSFSWEQEGCAQVSLFPPC
jgi:hypothetical protein